MAPRCVLSLILVLGLLAITACSPPPSSGKPRRQGPKINMAHFIKNTPTYKGKTITLGLKIDEGNQGRSLRDFMGKDVKFAAIAPNGEHLNLVITIPEGLSVPDLSYSSDVVVTFICKRGELRQGNVAKSIQPSDGPWEDAD